MRLKNIKGAIEYIEESNYVIKECKKYKGNFKSMFNNDNPISLEIGTGKEQFLYLRAINIKIICIDATEINDMFDKEIDKLYLNFSDPWPKVRHEKRRLTSSNFLKKYDYIFKDNAHIIMKTDNQSLFEYSVKSLTDYGYKINKLFLNLHETEEFNIQTEYEKKFSQKGFRIYKIEVDKSFTL